MMRVVIDSMWRDTAEIELSDELTPYGHLVTRDDSKFFNPTKGNVVYLEPPEIGAHPVEVYVKFDDNGALDPTMAPTRVPLQKSRITAIE